MQTHIIAPPRPWTIFVSGNVNDAREAVANWISSAPMRDVFVNRWVVIARVWADREQIESWFDDSHNTRGKHWEPGSLRFYIGH